MTITWLDKPWSPKIGDPSVMGWVTVIAYAVAALACARTWRCARRQGEPQAHPAVWLTLAVLLVLLGINKQLDLQTLLTRLGATFAKAAGWYEQRRPIQLIFVITIAALGLLVLGALIYLSRRSLSTLGLALLGIVLLLTFITVRAASFHHVDRFIHRKFAGVKVNWLLELGGIACVLVAALNAPRQWRRQSSADP